MRSLLLALLLTLGSLALHGQSNPPDCQFTVTFKSATTGPAFNNRTSGTATPCVKWRVAYFADGLQAPVSIQLEGANDSNGIAGTWAAIAAGNVYEGSNPLTSAAQGTAAMTAYFPWIRLNVTAFTTSGGPPNQIVARVYGYKGTSASARALYYQTMDDAGTPLAQEPALNLTGAGVSCVDNPGSTRTDCTFTGGGFVNPMTTLGDMISADTGGTPKKVSGNTSTVQKFLSQTGDGVNSADPSWQLPPALGSLTYYMTPTPSLLTNLSAIVTTDNKMLTPPFGSKTPIDIANNTAADVILQSFATDPGFPGITFIPAGIYIWHIHAYRLSGNRAVTLYAVFREVSSTGTPVGTIGTQTESTPALGAAENEYPLAMADGNTYPLAGLTSRIVIDVHAVFTGGSSNTTVRMYVGGTADSHISLPSNTVDSTSFVPYSGATNDVDLGSHHITGAPFIGDSGLGGTTGLVPAPAAGDAALGKYLSAGGGYSVPPGAGATIFSSTTTAGPDDSATETSVIGTVTGSKTIAANTFTNGAVLQARAQGFFSLPAIADSLTLKMKCGSTVIGSATLTPGAGVLTNGSWRFWLDIAARGTGAGGAFITNGLVELTGSVLTDTTAQVLNTTTVAYDFTTACAFDVTAQWGVAQVGETIQGTNVAAWFPGAPVTSVYGLTGAISPTAHNESAPLTCAAPSASGTAYTCSTSPTFTPAANDCVLLVADVASGASPTLAVNGAAALGLTKQQNGAALVANDLLANGQVLVCMDAASHWQMQGQTGNTSSGGIVPNSATGAATIAVLDQTDWTIVNGAVYDDFLSNAMGIWILDNSSLNWRCISKPISDFVGSNTTYTIYAQVYAGNTFGSTSTTSGFYLYDGTKLEGFEQISQAQSASPAHGSNRLRLEAINSVTSDNGTLFGGTTSVTSPLFSIKIVEDGVHRTWFYRAAGSWVQAYQENTDTFLTPNSVCVGGVSITSTAVNFSYVELRYLNITHP